MKTIRIYDDKYQIHMRDNGTIAEITRHNERWMAGDQLKHSKFVLALVQELEELKDIIVAFHRSDDVLALDTKGVQIAEDRANDPS